MISLHFKRKGKDVDGYKEASRQLLFDQRAYAESDEMKEENNG